MKKRSPVFSLLGACHNFHVTMHPFNNLTLAKFLFLAVLLNSAGKIGRLSDCMYISLNGSETILKQIMETMEETFMLLALLTMLLSDSLF